MTGIEQLLKDANDLCSKGRHAESLALFTQACERAPDSPFAWCNRAGVSFLLGDYEQAEAGYRRALDLDPALDEARYGLIRLHIARREWASAIERLLRDRPDAAHVRTPEWHYLHGIALENTGHEQEAAVAYAGAVAHGHRAALKPLLRLLLRMNRAEDALSACFASTSSAKDRWNLVQACLQACPKQPALHESAARLFIRYRQYAYAARMSAHAKRAFPERFSSDWPGFKDCAWL